MIAITIILIYILFYWERFVGFAIKYSVQNKLTYTDHSVFFRFALVIIISALINFILK